MRTHARPRLGGIGYPGRVSAVVMALVVLAGAAACGGDDGDDAGTGDEETSSEESSTTTERPESSTAAALTPEEEVVRDYTNAMVAFGASANPPNPDSPELASGYTGTALENARSTLATLLASGAGAQNSVEHNTSDIAIAGETATLEDCFVDTTQLVDLATGAPIGEPEVTTMQATIELQRVDGVWRIARQTQREEQCVPA